MSAFDLLTPSGPDPRAEGVSPIPPGPHFRLHGSVGATPLPPVAYDILTAVLAYDDVWCREYRPRKKGGLFLAGGIEAIVGGERHPPMLVFTWILDPFTQAWRIHEGAYWARGDMTPKLARPPTTPASLLEAFMQEAAQ